MPLLLLLVFLVVPVVEIYVIVQVGEAIGALPTVALLLLDGFVGAALFKREGRRAWRALNDALAARRLPAKEVADGALVVLGGALLITPGFVSDVFGVLCLLPPTRAVLRRLLTGAVGRRMVGAVGAAGALRTTRPGQGRSRRQRPPGRVVEGEVVRDAGEPDDPDSSPSGRH